MVNPIDTVTQTAGAVAQTAAVVATAPVRHVQAATGGVLRGVQDGVISPFKDLAENVRGVAGAAVAGNASQMLDQAGQGLLNAGRAAVLPVSATVDAITGGARAFLDGNPNVGSTLGRIIQQPVNIATEATKAAASWVGQRLPTLLRPLQDVGLRGLNSSSLLSPMPAASGTLAPLRPDNHLRGMAAGSLAPIRDLTAPPPQPKAADNKAGGFDPAAAAASGMSAADIQRMMQKNMGMLGGQRKPTPEEVNLSNRDYMRWLESLQPEEQKIFNNLSPAEQRRLMAEMSQMQAMPMQAQAQRSAPAMVNMPSAADLTPARTDRPRSASYRPEQDMPAPILQQSRDAWSLQDRMAAARERDTYRQAAMDAATSAMVQGRKPEEVQRAIDTVVDRHTDRSTRESLRREAYDAFAQTQRDARYQEAFAQRPEPRTAEQMFSTTPAAATYSSSAGQREASPPPPPPAGYSWQEAATNPPGYRPAPDLPPPGFADQRIDGQGVRDMARAIAQAPNDPAAALRDIGGAVDAGADRLPPGYREPSAPPSLPPAERFDAPRWEDPIPRERAADVIERIGDLSRDEGFRASTRDIADDLLR